MIKVRKISFQQSSSWLNSQISAQGKRKIWQCPYLQSLTLQVEQFPFLGRF